MLQSGPYLNFFMESLTKSRQEWKTREQTSSGTVATSSGWDCDLSCFIAIARRFQMPRNLAT